MTLHETPVLTEPDEDTASGTQMDTRRRSRDRGPVILVLAAVLAFVLGAVAGGLVGQTMGRGSLADVDARNEELVAQVADLKDDLDVTEAALDETLTQITACEDAIVTADLILNNRDAEREFFLAAAGGAVDAVLASEWLARDDEYLRLVAQYDMQADACLTGYGVSPAAY